MEIRELKPTAEAEFQVVGTDGLQYPVKFTVAYLGAYMIPDYVRAADAATLRLSRVMMDALVDVVVAWDLTENGQPIPCTEENKRRYFPSILGLRLAGEEPGEFLGWALLAFAGEQGNFLKN